MVRRGSTVRVRQRASRSPCRSALSAGDAGDEFGSRRPPNVHRPAGSPPLWPRNAEGMWLHVRSGRRPPSVHRPFDRERVEQGDGVFVAVAGEVAVVAGVGGGGGG